MAKRRHSEDAVTITAVAWHDSVLPQPLTFPPPYAELSTKPSGFSRWWQLAQYAFHLPDPSKFAPLPVHFTETQLESARHFVESCKELAGYALMSSSDSLRMSSDVNGNELWEASFSSKENIRAFAALFRQLYNKDDGSWFVVQGIISKAHRSVHDEHTDQREDILRAWRFAHGKLQQQRLEAIVGRMAANDYAGTSDRAPIPFEDLRPTELISNYFYGDLLHWGERRPQLASLGYDQVTADLDKFHFLEAMVGLAHYYLGFSQLVEKALPIDV